MDCQQQTSPQTPTRGEFKARIHKKFDLGAEYKSLKFELDLENAQLLANARPGQFIQIACRSGETNSPNNPFLRRPFSIASIEESSDKLIVEVIHNVIGPGTEWMANALLESPTSILGPLGNGFDLSNKNLSKAVLVGGGIGIPPLLFLADILSKLPNCETIGFAGMRSISNFDLSISAENADQPPTKPLMRLSQFNRSKTPSIIATDDGSYGFKGNAVAALEQFLSENPDWKDAQIFACGPDAMLHAVADLALKQNMNCQVCMEAYMACGFGVCQSCIVPAWIDPENTDRSNDNTKYELVCVSGPVFDSQKIAWEKYD